MNKYEMGVIIRADLPEDGFTLEMDKVKGHIERFGGTIDKIDEWGRRRMAYPIMKQTEGMYVFVTFTSPANAPKEVEARMRLMENVLRFLVVRKDEVEAVVIPAPAPVVVPAEEPPAAAAPVEEVPAEEVASEEAPASAEQEA